MKKDILKDLVADIEASNEAFEKMSKREKRVQIAKDCILRIQAKQLNPLGMFYISENFTALSPEEGSIKDFVNSPKMPSCTVCAKGGLFLSAIARASNLDFCDWDAFAEFDADEDSEMSKVFTPAQLELMEKSFEGWGSGKEFKFHSRFNTDEERLIAICENIIRNKGRFII